MKYPKSILETAVRENISMAGVLCFLGLKISGGSYAYIKRRILEYEISTSHFKGQAHNKGLPSPQRLTREQFITRYLIYSNTYPNTDRIKDKLLEYRIKSYVCEKCGGTKWNGIDIPLELHHKDGNRFNNDIENLELLCPNCHAQTETYCGKKNKKRKPSVLYDGKRRTLVKYGIGRKVDRPTLTVLLDEVKQFGYTATGRKYRVSDNAIRKWIGMYEKIEKIKNAEVANRELGRPLTPRT